MCSRRQSDAGAARPGHVWARSDAITTYAIRGGAEGKRRLDLLARTLDATTEALLDRAGLRAGMRCVDVGCGGGHVTRSLSRRVGPAGSVVGLDLDEVKLTSAREECRQAGTGNIEFRIANVAEWSEPATYDLVYGRFILSHLASRVAVLSAMRDALRPGGTLVLEDIDFAGAFCYPPHPAFARYCALYRAVIQRRGGDADLGPQIYGLCTGAGLERVEVSVVHPVHTGAAPEKALSLSTLVNIGDAVLAEGLATAEELRRTIEELKALTEDYESLVALPRIFQVLARRAGGAPAVV